MSKKLVGVELKYPELHKIALALVHSARRLNHYFQGCIVKVYTEYPLKKKLQTRQELGRLAEWSSFLSSFHIIYEPNLDQKGHIILSSLGNFPIKYLPGESDEDMLVSPLVRQESATPSEQPLRLVVNSAHVASSQESTSSCGELPIFKHISALWSLAQKHQ